MIEDKNLAQKKDDSKEMVTIDYFDRIHKQWIKLDVTKEVALFMKADDQQRRRKQNQYDFYNKQFDSIFNESKPENEKFLADESSNPQVILENKEKELIDMAESEHYRTLIENSLCTLTPTQREVVEKTFYENKSENDIAEELGISQQAVSGRLLRAEKNIKNNIKNTEN